MSGLISSNKIFIWSRKNLFSNWVNALITVLSIYFIYEVSFFFLDWAVFKADFLTNFRGEKIIDRTFCSKNIEPGSHGACWAIIHVRFHQFMYGFYPAGEVWRVNLVFILLPIALIAIFFDKVPFRKYLLYFTFIFPFISFYLLYGGPSLPPVGTNKWGGLLVTLFLGVT